MEKLLTTCNNRPATIDRLWLNVYQISVCHQWLPLSSSSSSLLEITVFSQQNSGLLCVFSITITWSDFFSFRFEYHLSVL